jgi:hypothetical protein
MTMNNWRAGLAKVPGPVWAGAAIGAALAIAPLRPLGVTALLALLYMLPAFVAFERHVPSKGSVVVVNVLLGWTLIGWIVALAMAMRDPRPAP